MTCLNDCTKIMKYEIFRVYTVEHKSQHSALKRALGMIVPVPTYLNPPVRRRL